MADEWEYSSGCPKCGETMKRSDCPDCGGEGSFEGEDLVEEDPLWYNLNSYESCSNCRGRGYFEWCPNESCGWDNAAKRFWKNEAATEAD